MNFDGRGLQILTGVTMVYAFAPLKNRGGALSEVDADVLERMHDRVASLIERLWVESGAERAPTRAEVIRGRLAASGEVMFDDSERRLLLDALAACATEMDQGGDVNIHFNGDEYGISAEHLRAVTRRLEEAGAA